MNGGKYRTLAQTAATITNCYNIATDAASTTHSPETRIGTDFNTGWIGNGHFTYYVNTQAGKTVYYQNIDAGTADTYPVLDDSHGIVYETVTSGTNKYYANSTSDFTLASMTLKDAENFSATGAFTATSLTYNRTLEAGGYNSLCLPFAITKSMLSAAGGKLFTLSAVGTDAVTLSETDRVEAGVPCFASVTSNFTFGTMSNVDMVASEDNSGSVKGTFTEITDIVGVYKLDSKGEYFALTAAKDDEKGISAPVIKPFRSYIAGGASGVKTLNILLSDGTFTGLTPALSEEREAAVYDLAGRRVQKATKGIYIVNGKKVMK